MSQFIPSMGRSIQINSKNLIAPICNGVLPYRTFNFAGAQRAGIACLRFGGSNCEPFAQATPQP